MQMVISVEVFSADGDGGLMIWALAFEAVPTMVWRAATAGG
jgi:hypothetical protein